MSNVATKHTGNPRLNAADRETLAAVEQRKGGTPTEARRLLKLVVVEIALVVGACWLMYGVYRYRVARDQKALFFCTGCTYRFDHE
ncbi:MAG: hypothetical protein KAW89_04150 [Armatimonadetes bacterium]|nr:hypothetical protein [Armatimonadota bacterium]